MLERLLKETPPELLDALLQLTVVPRYTRIYAEGIFRDSTAAHVLRCVDIAQRLPIDDETRSKVSRLLWIHDITELIVTDYTSIEKENQELESRLEEEEKSASEILLSPKDRDRLTEFDIASNFLKNNKGGVKD